jgi:general secretion pathway protein K
LTSNTVAFLCGMQRKVGAAPHRGNANRPLTIQGKANAQGKQTNKRRTGKNPKY